MVYQAFSLLAALALTPSQEMHGLYRSPEGARIALFPAPGAPDASAMLLMETGVVRVLTERESGEFTYGPALLVAEPVSGTLAFERGGGARAGLVLRSGDVETSFARVPLRQEPLAFTHGEVHLAGTLLLPPGDGPFPAVVMLHGSEPEPRAGNLGMALLFASEGIAALIFDKRGVGESSGSEWRAAFEEYAGDARAGFAAVAAHPSIEAERIGYWGHSQGAWVAALAAKDTPSAAFAVLECGGALDPVETTLWSYRSTMQARGILSERQIEDCLAYHRRKFDVLASRLSPEELEPFTAEARKQPWFRNVTERIPEGPFWEANVAYDPRPALEGLEHCAVLALYAEHDDATPSDASMAAARAAFERAGHARAAVRLVPAANHGFFETKTGKPLREELPTLERFAPGYAALLVGWLKDTLGLPK